MKLLNKNLSSLIFKYLNRIVLLSCFVVFAIQVEIFFELYLQKATILGINYEERSNRPYLSASFCPQDVFKHGGIPINRTEFHRLSFKVVTHPISTDSFKYTKGFELFTNVLLSAGGYFHQLILRKV